METKNTPKVCNTNGTKKIQKHLETKQQKIQLHCLKEFPQKPDFQYNIFSHYRENQEP